MQSEKGKLFMAKKEKIKEVKYNITGEELEKYIKVKTFKMEQLAEATNYLRKVGENLNEIKNIYHLFETCAIMIDNENFKPCETFIKSQLERGKEAIEATEKQFNELNKKVSALQKQWDTYFENLPVVNGIAIVQPNVLTYCEVEFEGL